MSSDKTKDFLLTILITIVLCLLSMLPVAALSILCTAAVAGMLGYSVTRFHYGYVAFHGCIILAVSVLFLQNFALALQSCIPAILCGITMGICYNIKLSALKLLCITTSVYTLNTITSIKLAGTSPDGKNLFEEAVSAAGMLYKEALVGVYGTQIQETEVNQIVAELTSMLLKFSPAFIIIMCIFLSLLSYWIFKSILKKKKMDTDVFTSFSQWKAEKSTSILYIVMWGLYFIAPTDTLFSDVLLNVITIMTVIFFILGLSLLEFMLQKRVKHTIFRKLILIGVSILCLILTGLPFFTVAVGGILDGFINYRTRKKVS